MRTAFRLLMAALKAILIDHSTPVTVTPNAYTTSASARPQVLSNGWVVTCEYDSTNVRLVLQVDKQNGQGFTQLCTIGNGSSALTYFSIVSYGTRIFVIFSTATTNMNYISIDVTQAIDVLLWGNTYSWQKAGGLDLSQTAFSGCSLTIDSTGSYLHAAWSSKNSTYPNSFNIRRAWGTINADGSVTWATASYYTSYNIVGYDMTNPCAIYLPNGTAGVVYVSKENTNYYIRFNYSSYTYAVYNGGSYAQFSPDAICDKNGVLWVVWYGKDATDSTRWNIRYSNSTDGGVTWSTAIKLTTGSTTDFSYPSITFDENNKIYVLYCDGSIGGIYKITYDGAWSTITTLVGSTNTPVYPSTCVNYQNFTDPICIYKESSSVKFRGVWTETP